MRTTGRNLCHAGKCLRNIDLAQRVRTPAPYGPTGRNCACELAAGTDLLHVDESNWNSGATVAGESPARDCMISLEGACKCVSARADMKSGHSCWRNELSIGIGSPACDSVIEPERACHFSTRTNFFHVGKICWRDCLSKSVRAPACKRRIRAQYTGEA